VAVGAILTSAEINSTASQVARQVFAALDKVEQFKAFMDTKTDPELVTLGFVQADVNLLRSAMSDLAQLSSIFLGQVNLSVAKDFRTFAKQLIGTGLY
jgi:hypothetical protein